ncbi:MAG: 3-methylmercaptopropionyl-CoA dehydrogenase [Flavobacteriales bacterium]|nr:MAG: 3-methylmercaptopropionyl-CoA dehydrogenase [Flavobacteriales bacterium]|tara:strand:+ start:1233 stop:3044 length:1812 start_codon:yes stop_codon:yes gene_type:complete
MASKYIDLSTVKFFMNNVQELESVLKKERFVDHDLESVDLFIESVKHFADRELFPYFKEMDEKPAHYKDGTIHVHQQVEKMMKEGGAMGLISAPFDYEDGGLQLPLLVHTAANYILDAANNHLPGYSGLTSGAAELIVEFANKNLKEKYTPKMLTGEWGGTMCLTEPQSGSSLSDIVTKATPFDGNYKISGQKIFISGGDHQYANNIVHLLLARVEGAPAGTKGISLFVVPKMRLEENGDLSFNDVTTVADFEKMGQKGYCTTHLSFGDKDDCHGYLVGEENKGLEYMFLMMNGARIAVGRGASAIACAAYYASLEYANERPQGRKLSSDGTKNLKDKQSLIIEHPDVRRMLLLQKSMVEGSMNLIFKAAKYFDLHHNSTDIKNKHKYHTLLEMIIPVVKTYPSEAGIYSINNGLQVLGGYGFCSDFILQQYYRDIRISSIYEGTTGIQSQDLLGRKMMLNNGEGSKLLLEEIQKTIDKANQDNELKEWASSLNDQLDNTQKILFHLMPFAIKGDYEKFLADASVFMEFFSLIIVGWSWLEIGVATKHALSTNNTTLDSRFYQGKLDALEYFYVYELPKTKGLAEILLHPSSVTIKKNENVIN